MLGTHTRAEAFMKAVLDEAGVSCGPEGHHDLVVRDPTMWTDWLARGSLAMGETYMDGKWEAEALDDVLFRLNTLTREEKRRLFSSWSTKLLALTARIVNYQSQRRARIVTEAHYDLGNEFFQGWLDARMIYTCGYWKSATDLDSAQVAKLRLVGDKLMLQPGMRVLDVGCGWGGCARFLADEYGVDVVGVNIAKEQIAWAREHVAGRGVEIVHCDYRMLSRQFGNQSFDRVLSVGMFEHVGHLNYASYMQNTSDVLINGGLALLHTIGGNRSVTRHPDAFIGTYIFPNGMLPSAAQLSQSIERRFILEDWQNFGPDYDKTLLAWSRNFEQYIAENPGKHPERFVRMWRYYLLLCAAAFRSRAVQLWQVVLSKHAPNAYRAPR